MFQMIIKNVIYINNVKCGLYANLLEEFVIFLHLLVLFWLKSLFYFATIRQ